MSFEHSETVSREFFDHLVTSHTLGHDGFHGRDHWLRVLQNAREIATETGASLSVVELFTVLHDSKRENENHDPDHGHRAAAYRQPSRAERGRSPQSGRHSEIFHRPSEGVGLTKALEFPIFRSCIKSWADARANLPRPARWFPERGCGPRQLMVVSVVSPPRKRRRFFLFST